jgi:hypothetical protein
VPIVSVIVDTPERVRRWLAIVDQITDETGLGVDPDVPIDVKRVVGRGRWGRRRR